MSNRFHSTFSDATFRIALAIIASEKSTATSLEHLRQSHSVFFPVPHPISKIE
jgi:hypothetical protein